MNYKRGDIVQWTSHPADREALLRSYGPGPFQVRGVEYGAPEEGQWLSLRRLSDGKVWSAKVWKWIDETQPSKGYQAFVPTIHSDWVQPAGEPETREYALELRVPSDVTEDELRSALAMLGIDVAKLTIEKKEEDQ